MPNKWIEHVKTYATENGLSYKDALKSEDCKNKYKSTKVDSKEEIVEEHRSAGAPTVQKKKRGRKSKVEPIEVVEKACDTVEEPIKKRRGRKPKVVTICVDNKM